MAVIWTIIMHLRELRLLIHSRYLLSPALLSPHHITPRIKSPYRLLRGSLNKMSRFFLVTSQSWVDRLTANWHMCKIQHESHRTVLSLCRRKIKRCLDFNATNSIYHTQFVYLRNHFILVTTHKCSPASRNHFLILSFSLLVVCLSCKWACLFSLTSLHVLNRIFG